MKKKIKLLLIGGGSGGHLYPLLTLAQEVCDKNILQPENLHFVIAKNNADYKYFESNELYKTFTYSQYSVAKLRRYFDVQNFIDFFIFIKNIFTSLSFLLFNRPEKIFSKGGFVSLPFGISAFCLGIPFYLHETDSVMGLSNKILSRFAKKIFTGFPISSHENNEKYIFVGNPIRPEFFDYKHAISENISDIPLRVLIFGGSQGASALNEWARDFFDISNGYIDTLQIQKNIEVLIVAGKNKSDPEKIEEINAINKNFGVNIMMREVEFLTSDFISEVHKADVVITRAGGSISELSAARKCVIVIPLPSAANNHQEKNAEYFASKNAVLHVKEIDLYNKNTYNRINTLLASKEMQERYSDALADFSQTDAVQKLITYLPL